MVPELESLSSLSNPLATVEQLSNSSSSLDGVPPSLESSIRFAGLQITQAAGILLRIPQEIIAQAMVVFTRFYVGPEGGSVRNNGAKVGLQVPTSLSDLPLTRAALCIGRLGGFNLYCRQTLSRSSHDSVCLQCLRLPHVYSNPSGIPRSPSTRSRIILPVRRELPLRSSAAAPNRDHNTPHVIIRYKGCSPSSPRIDISPDPRRTSTGSVFDISCPGVSYPRIS